jgi:excisionase family DNA binding protein
MKAPATRSEQDAMIIGMSRPSAPIAGRRRPEAPEPVEEILSEPLMDVQEVAAFLHVSKSMVYKLAEQEALPAVRIGRLVRFRRRDVAAFVQRDIS